MFLKKGTSGSVCILAALGVAGCGGGQQGGASAASHTSTAGNAVFTYAGQPKPLLTTSSGNVSVLGQAGATFSSLTLEPPPNLLDTYLVITRISSDEVFGLYKLPWSGTIQSLYQSPNSPLGAEISAYGTIAFNTNVDFNAYTVHADGSGLKQLSFTGLSNVTHPAYAVDGTNRVTFCDSSGHLYVGPGTGGTATLIQSNAAHGLQIWNPTGTAIAYTYTNGSTTEIYQTAPSGGGSVNITPPPFQSSFIQPLSWSPDGSTILSLYTSDGGTTNQLVKFEPTGPGYAQTLTPSGLSDDSGVFSPDGQKIAFYRSSSGGATPGIYVEDTFGDGATMLVPDPSNGADSEGIAWSPFLPKETVVAVSGSTFYHKAASGFLLSQNNARFGSLVAFTATTPSSASIQAPSTTTGSASLLFTITADSITSIGYINSYFDTGTTLTLTSTPTVVVSIDANTGQVALVAPAAKAGSTKNADGTVTYSGQFQAVYNGAGKNVAPSGASKLTVDPKTGRLVSFG